MCSVCNIIITFFTLKLSRATVAVFPATFLLVSSALLAPIFLLIFYVHVVLRKPGMKAEEQSKIIEKEESKAII